MFKVLSIDGGGIKGAHTAAMLRELERALAEVPAEVPLSHHSDCDCKRLIYNALVSIP
ncbi:MAG: hypothetical protein ACYDH9_07190 [Limisphaerales bacterium]